MKRFVIITGLILFGLQLMAQGRYQAGLMPSINYSAGIGDGWKLNFKAESRQRFILGTFGESGETGYKYILTDLAAVASKKVGLNNSLAGGYQLRIREGELIHRLIQQFSVLHRFDNFRLAQRFAADQSFFENGKMELRLRYRLSSEFPLNGQTVDPGEFYLKINNEYLNAFYNSNYDLEIRVAPMAGYEFTDQNKLEVGLDYRVSGFINNVSRNNFWITLNWFFSS